MRECEAEVVSTEGKNIKLNQTVFYAFSGGQASDSGEINGIPVDEAIAGEEIVYKLEGEPNFREGDKVEVKTIDGSGKLTIPSGTTSGSVFKLKNKGVQILHGNGKGDHFVEVEIEVPKHLSREQKKLVKELREKEL